MSDFKEKQASQNKPAGEATSTESLKEMSPVELANALELMLESMTEENYAPDLIDAYLDALDQKVPMPEEGNDGEILDDIKKKVNTLSFSREVSARMDSPVHRTRRRPFKRAVVTIAATVTLLLALMIGVQAAGIDVFGNLARWTDELFFFIPSSGENIQELTYSIKFQAALEEQKLPKELAPTWFPDGFAADEPEVWVDDVSTAVQLSFKSPEGKTFAINIEQYVNSETLGMLPFEKDTEDVELYTSDGRTFYIMNNINTAIAAWADGDMLETIRGELSVDEIKTMINSMGG